MRKVFKLKSEGCAVGDTLNTGAQKKNKNKNKSLMQEMEVTGGSLVEKSKYMK